MASQNFDVVIIGGGIMGVSTAFQLARRGVERVAVLEKGPHVASGSTGQSTAVVRQRYANEEVVRLAHWSLQMFHRWCERLELREDRSGFTPAGVVWVPDVSGDCGENAAEMFARVGAKGGMVDVAEVRDRYPDFNLCHHAVALDGAEHECATPQRLFWEPDGGFADPQATTEDLLRAATNLGVEVFTRHEVVAIESADGGTFRVQCGNDGNFTCQRLLNAAGPWCNRVNTMAGVELPMKLMPTCVQMAVRDRPAEVIGELPVFISAADEVYGRPEARGTQLLIGSVSADDERERVDDPDRFDAHVDPAFRDRMMHKLHHRFAMKSRGTVHGYAALYTVNVDDWHPIVDQVGPAGYYVANGFSGHGFKLGPSMGALIARLVSGVAMPDDPPVDAAYFSATRQPIPSSGGVLA